MEVTENKPGAAVVKTGVHSVDREFESRLLRQSEPDLKKTACSPHGEPKATETLAAIIKRELK